MHITLSYQVCGDIVRAVKFFSEFFAFDLAIDDFFTRLLTLTSYLSRRCIRFIGEILSLYKMPSFLFVKSIICLIKCLKHMVHIFFHQNN